MSGISYKVYGKTAALSVETTRTRATERAPTGVHTISFEMASFDSSDSAAGANWDNKVIIQVTPTELPQVIAVLCGHSEQVEFKYHGKDKNKGYSISQSHLSITTKGIAHAVHLAPIDRFEISALGMKQLQRRHGSLSSDVIYRVLADCYR